MEPLLLDKPPVVVVLTWEPIVMPGVDRYRVRRELPEGAGWEIIGDTTAPPFEVPGVVADLAARFAVSPVFSDGTEPPEETWETATIVPGITENGPAKPDALESLGAVQNGPALHFAWTPPRLGTAREVEIRMGIHPGGGDTWAHAIHVARLPIVLGCYVWPWLAPGTSTFMAKTVDDLGRYSDDLASATVIIGPLVNHVTIATENEDGGSWPGAQTDVAEDSGDLVLGPKPAVAADWDEVASSYTYPACGPFLPEGTYETVPVDHGFVDVSRLEVEILGTTPDGFLATAPASSWKFVVRGLVEDFDGVPYRRGRRLILDRHNAAGHPLYGLDVTIEIATSESATGTLGSVVWGDWRRFLPGEYRARWHKFRVTMRGDGWTSPLLDRLRFYRRRRNVKCEGSDSLLGSGFTSVSFPADVTFYTTPTITASLVGAYGDVVTLEITSKTTGGFNVEAFDEDGNSVAADIDWHALGN